MVTSRTNVAPSTSSLPSLRTCNTPHRTTTALLPPPRRISVVTLALGPTFTLILTLALTLALALLAAVLEALCIGQQQHVLRIEVAGAHHGVGRESGGSGT